VLRLDPGLRALPEERVEPLVPEALDHILP
jgi:hypothetical protein